MDEENTEEKPVVLMVHTTINGTEMKDHGKNGNKRT